MERASHLLELARYVVLNPVRAKMVRSAKDWPWSSYRATSGQAEKPEHLTVDWVLSQFDSDRSRAISAYRMFVRQGKDTRVWDDLRAGSLLGSEEFAERMRPRLQDVPLDQNVLRRERDAARPDLAVIFKDVTDRQDRDARIHEAVRRYHYRLQEVGDYLGLHFTTISVIARREAAENLK